MAPNPTRKDHSKDGQPPQQPMLQNTHQSSQHPSKPSDTGTKFGENGFTELSNGLWNGLPNDPPNGLPNGLPNWFPNGQGPPGQTSERAHHIPTATDTRVHGCIDYTITIPMLEVARETPDALRDQRVKDVLEQALHEIWRRIAADPEGYIMSRDEFAVFNFFQYLYDDDIRRRLAAKARANYWYATKGPLVRPGKK
ncbi:hypothetical protein F4776DRAFT_611365 [Hypoxylon sp. NC0597]|nr:hypothetical protein F4776DRAFT_611365 [Hypoxylon sp. NC0597]